MWILYIIIIIFVIFGAIQSRYNNSLYVPIVNESKFPSLQEEYKKWCEQTKRGGAILIGGSIKEFFDYCESKYIHHD